MGQARFVQLPFRSSAVNGFLFIFIDILGIWAIHRGLAALQAYYHFRSALDNDAEITVKRSRIPVISGDLLAGRTRFPSVFIVVHIVVVALAFAATLGVNGATAPIWNPLDYSFVTSVAPNATLDENGAIFGRVGGSAFQCRTQTLTTMTIWPLAFNRSENDNVWAKEKANWRKGVGRCMRDVPDLDRLLHVKCDHLDNCDINRHISAAETPSARLVLTSPVTTESFSTYSVSETISSSGIVYVSKIFASQLPQQTSSERAFLIWAIGSTPENNTYNTLSWGSMKWVNATNGTAENIVTIQVDSFTSDDPLPSAASFYARVEEYYKIYAGGKPRRRSGAEMVELFLMAAISAESAGGRSAERELETADVTDVRLHSLVMYIFLAVLALVLGITKEIIRYLVIPAGGHKASEVFSCDPNSLSEALGAALERSRGLHTSGKMAVIRKYSDEDGKERVGPFIRRRVIGDKEISAEDDDTADSKEIARSTVFHILPSTHPPSSPPDGP